MKRFKFSVVSLISVIVLCFSLGGSLFAIADSQPEEGVVSGEIVEDYVQGKIVHPGETVKKVVQVKNTGTLDTVVRLKAKPSWGTLSLSTDNVVLNYSTQDWLQKEEYYYYREILHPLELTPVFFDSFTFKSTGNDNGYKGARGTIDVSMEMLEASPDGLEPWDITYAELGIEPPHSGSDNTSKIDFIDFTEGFVPEQGTSDLISYKDLDLGSSLSQNVSVTNKCEEPVGVYLSIVFPDDVNISELDSAAEVVIESTELGVLYAGGVVQIANDSLLYISYLSQDQISKLKITISLPETTSQETYNALQGAQWQFTAKGNLPNPATTPHSTDQPENSTTAGETTQQGTQPTEAQSTVGQSSQAVTSVTVPTVTSPVTAEGTNSGDSGGNSGGSGTIGTDGNFTQPYATIGTSEVKHTDVDVSSASQLGTSSKPEGSTSHYNATISTVIDTGTDSRVLTYIGLSFISLAVLVGDLLYRHFKNKR